MALAGDLPDLKDNEPEKDLDDLVNSAREDDESPAPPPENGATRPPRGRGGKLEEYRNRVYADVNSIFKFTFMDRPRRPVSQKTRRLWDEYRKCIPRVY